MAGRQGEGRAGGGVERPEPRLMEGARLPYLLSVPAGRDAPPAGYPLLCFLHGHDEAAPTEIRRGLTRHGPLRPTSSPRAVRDFVVVAPQLPGGGDIWDRHAGAVGEIVLEAQQAHGDPARTYLTGFSFGGNGVFDLALAQPGLWAALWAVDPTRAPREDPGRPVWLSFGEVARRGKRRFIDALGLEPVGVATDGARLYLDEGHDHVGSAAAAYTDDRIYEWLLARRLP